MSAGHDLRWDRVWLCKRCLMTFADLSEGKSSDCPGREDNLKVEDFVAIGVSKRTAQGYLCGTPQGFRPVPGFLLWSIARLRLENGRKAPLVRWLVQLEDLAKSAGRLIG